MSHRPYLLSLLFALAACGGPSVDEGTLLEGDAGTEELETRQDERTARMNITVQTLNASGAVTSETQVDPSELSTMVYESCATAVVPLDKSELASSDASKVGPCSSYTYAGQEMCWGEVCRVQLYSCQANKLLEIAAGVGNVRIDALTGDNGATVTRRRVPAVTTEAKTQLAEGALWMSMFASMTAGDNLRSYAGIPQVSMALGCTLNDSEMNGSTLAEIYKRLKDNTSYAGRLMERPDWESNTQTLGEYFAMSLAELSQIAQEAADDAVTYHLAVADAERGKSDPAVASQLGWTDPTMSRARAAHLLVGGAADSELHYFWGEGMCPAQELDAETKKALDVLRQAAGSPALVDVKVPLKNVLEGTAAAPQESVRARLAERLNEPSLQTMDGEQLAQHFGVSTAALEKARNYMRHEVKAFGRDLTVQSPATPLASASAGGSIVEQFTTTPNYAALAVPPTAPPGNYYNAITRYAKPWQFAHEVDQRPTRSCSTSAGCPMPGDVCTQGQCVPAATASVSPTSTYPFNSLIHALDYAGSVAHDLLSFSSSRTGGTGPALGDRASNILAMLASTIRSQRPARLESCYQYVTASNVDRYRFRVFGERYPEQFLVVKGTAGLRCAVDGHIDEAPCRLSDWTVPSIARTARDVAPSERRYGFTEYVELSFDTNLQTSPLEWLFVVKRKSGAADAPGGYQQYGYTRTQRMQTAPGWDVTYHYAGNTWTYCIAQPIVPEHEHRAASIIAPSEENCSRPNETCAGFEFADKIPLENELTDDSNGVESSWRHYLSLAKEAAEFADRLGEDLITHGYSIDERIEQAEESLEGICGTVNIRELAWGSLDGARGGDCDPKDTKACSGTPGYICLNGECVRNLDEAVRDLGESGDKEQAADLAACLGEDSMSPAAALGTKKLCVWEAPDSNKWCTSVDKVTDPCPFPALPDAQTNPKATVETACPRPEGLPDKFNMHLITDTLNLFEPLSEGWDNPPTAWTFDCGAIRRFRKGEQTDTDVKNLKSSLDLHWSRIQQVAKRVGWTAYPDDYSAITVDKQVKWSTGYPLVQATNVDAASYQTPVWPCGGPDFTVKDDVGALQTGCKMKTSDSLFESFTCDCASRTVDGAKERARMNHRMGRAVLALRTITASGLDGFVAPYQPDSYATVWAADRDSEACKDGSGARCDYLGMGWKFESDDSAVLVGGRMLTEGSGLYYWVKETDDSDDEKTFDPQPGRAYCWPIPEGQALPPIWHHVEGFKPTDRTIAVTSACHWIGSRGKHHGDEAPVLFKEYSSVEQDVASATGFWKNIGADSGKFDGGIEPGLIYDILTNPNADPETIRIRPLNKGKSVNSYFLGCYATHEGPSDDPWGKHENLGNCEADVSRGDLETYNRWKLAQSGLTERDILDAVELACTVAQEEGVSCLEGAPAEPRTFRDLSMARKQLECMANSILNEAQYTIMRDVPKEVLPGNADTHAYEGERGAEVSNLVSAFQNIKEYQSNISYELLSFASDVEKLRLALRHTNVAAQLAKLEQQSTMWSQASACAASAAKGTGSIVGAVGSEGLGLYGAIIGGGGEMVATCANSIAQIALAYQRLELEEEQLEIQDGMSWEDFRTRFRDHHKALNDFADKLRGALHQIAGSVAAVEAHRQQARRALGKGLLWASDEAGRQFATNAVMRARYNTTFQRYQRSLKYAKRMAYLARRALEQRLGMDLESITHEMALVEKPSDWVNDVCTLTGIDYQNIAKDNLADGSYAEGYIGDYIRKLEGVYESYSIDYSFSDGEDTAVVSLRDDILLSRSYCAMTVNNALERSAELDSSPWHLENCTELAATVPECVDGVDDDDDGIDDVTGAPVARDDECGTGEGSVRACARVRRLTELNTKEPGSAALLPVPTHSQPGSSVDGFRVTFGGDGNPANSSFKRKTYVSQTDNTVWAQRVVLQPGVYRLSWRGRMPTDLPPPLVAHDPGEAVSVSEVGITQVRDDNGDVVSESESIRPITVVRAPALTGYGWPLYYLFFEVRQLDQEIRVEINPRLNATNTHVVDVAAFMLEQVDSAVPLSSAQANPDAYAPGTYTATLAANVAELPLCEDTTGVHFRKQWRRGCARICPAGLDTCANGVEQCYWERTFTLPIEDIENKSKLSRAGFAYGNYNYRIDSIGLNFTGSATRNCSGSQFPSTCYSAGYIPYSLYHHDGFVVRNHRGELYEAPLFQGVIEGGRGLAAERYITNPISRTDQDLLGPYVRRELSGRPLTGDYVLRVWDAEGVSFEGIEDVQLVLKYRYWTRIK